MKKLVKKIKGQIFHNRRSFYENRENIDKEISLDLGKRKLFFAQTYGKKTKLSKALKNNSEGTENVAVYVQNPQVLLDIGKGDLFLDPSLCFRLELNKYMPPKKCRANLNFRLLMEGDAEQVNRIYKEYGMCKIDEKTIKENQYAITTNYYVAEKNGKILGIIIGVNHEELFNSPEKGSSLWGLAVLPRAEGKGIGSLLIDYLVGRYRTMGLSYMDLYVDYYNKRAIHVYKKLGFQEIPRFYVYSK